MDDVQLRFGIPDLELNCVRGGTINPAAFVGHELTVLFLPADETAAIRQLQDYRQHAHHFSDCDAWVLDIVQEQEPSAAILAASPALALDPEHIAWNAFERLLSAGVRHPWQMGGVYLFGRGGGLQRAWFGTSGADEVVRELNAPGSG